MHSKKILIHIGMGRCGSSSIQYALSSKRLELAAKGINYPATRPGDDAQHVLGWLTDDKIEESEQSWREVLSGFTQSGSHTLLVSTENFTAIPYRLFDSIRKMLAGYSVEVIFIIRNQRELLPSIYAQWIKARIAFRSFDHFYRVTKKEWHFPHILKRWSDAYGVENMKCAVLRPKSDAIQLFSECCGEDGGVREILRDTNIRMNAGINPALLRFLVLFDRLNSRNKISSTFPGWNHIEPSRPDRNAWVREKLVNFLEIRSKSRFEKSRWNLSKKLQSEIAAEYEATNTEFHAKYLGQEPKDWFGSVKSKCI